MITCHHETGYRHSQHHKVECVVSSVSKFSSLGESELSKAGRLDILFQTKRTKTRRNTVTPIVL